MPVSLVRTRLTACVPILLAICLISAQNVEPTAAHAATARSVAAADDQTSAFLGRLLDAINKRRDAVGTQHLGYIPPDAAAPLDGFLDKTLPSLTWPRPCGHRLLSGAFSWDYVRATGFEGEARGEVLACPGPEPYWTPDLAAEQWWESPSHFAVLYADPYANALGCSASGLRDGAIASKGNGKNRRVGAASAILCVTFREGGAASVTGTVPVGDASFDGEADASDESPLYVEDDLGVDEDAESDGDAVDSAASDDAQAVDDDDASADADAESADDGEADTAEDPEPEPATEWEVDSEAGSVEVTN
jgi:hypothetical protein